MAKTSVTYWDPTASAAENAKLRLPGLASHYFAAGRKLMEGKPSPEGLHGFRLVTKRFRYTLELFRPCYGKSLENRLSRLREVQTRLGEISDCATALALIQPASRHPAMIAFLKKRARQRTVAFRQYWQQTFDTPGQERWWKQYLARYPKSEAPRKRK
jgi:CHAD domain-containing protein